MNTHNEGYQIKVIKFVQELLLDEENRVAVTPALIDDKIELVLKMNPKWGVNLNKQMVIDELIRQQAIPCRNRETGLIYILPRWNWALVL